MLHNFSYPCERQENKRNEFEQTKRCVSRLVFTPDLFGEANGALLV